ncbi:MAG TPA: porin [Pirellulales bacterium]|nr:porin [Pirellulales bacterium]
MYRCHHMVMAALIAVGGLGLTSDGSVAWSAEPSGEAPSSFQSSNSNPVERVAPAPTPRWPRNWESPNGVTFRLRGRVDTDVISSAQSPANEATFGDMGDVVGLRRARIGAEGKLGDDRRYIAEIDLASGFVVPRDVYLSFGNLQERGEFRAGHLREPFSFEGGTSARYFAFMERAPVNLLDPARNRGLGFFRENLGADASLGLGVFHAGSDAGDFQGGDRSTVGFTGRLTTAPHYEQNGKRLFHLGLALSERVPERGIIIINQQPLSPLLDLGDSSTTPFVPAIRIPASFQQLPNLQFAATRGSLWTQAEWYGTLIDQTGGGLVFFRGCHLDCGYFITGEHRAYEATNGTLGDSRQSPVIARPGFT